MDLSSALSAFSAVPLDWIIIAVVFIILAIDAVRAGSVRACALALSFPLSFFLFQSLSQTLLLGSILGQFQTPIAEAIIFLILEAILFVCIHQMLFSYDRYSSLISATVAGLAGTIVVLVVWIQVPALQSLWHFSPQIEHVFGASYSFLWLIGSYLGLAFVGS